MDGGGGARTDAGETERTGGTGGTAPPSEPTVNDEGKTATKTETDDETRQRRSRRRGHNTPRCLAKIKVDGTAPAGRTPGFGGSFFFFAPLFLPLGSAAAAASVIAGRTLLVD